MLADRQARSSPGGWTVIGDLERVCRPGPGGPAKNADTPRSRSAVHPVRAVDNDRPGIRPRAGATGLREPLTDQTAEEKGGSARKQAQVPAGATARPSGER
jgi:hypothetical protein